MNPQENTRLETILGEEETTNLKLVKCLGDEIIGWVEALFRFMPGRLGGGACVDYGSVGVSART